MPLGSPAPSEIRLGHVVAGALDGRRLRVIRFRSMPGGNEPLCTSAPNPASQGVRPTVQGGRGWISAEAEVRPSGEDLPAAGSASAAASATRRGPAGVEGPLSVDCEPSRVVHSLIAYVQEGLGRPEAFVLVLETTTRSCRVLGRRERRDELDAGLAPNTMRAPRTTPRGHVTRYLGARAPPPKGDRGASGAA